jgi:hypothetical protein
MNHNGGFTYHLAESGRFVAHSNPHVATPPIVLSNPGNIAQFEQTNSFYGAWDEIKVDVQSLKPKVQPWAQIDDFIAYGRAVIDIAEHLVIHQPHCCLAPLRGAGAPAPLAEMTTAPRRVSIDYFDYRERWATQRRLEIIAELKIIIAQKNVDFDTFHLVVIDCSIGGNGIADLVPIIKEVWSSSKRYSQQRWILDIHLLHDLRGRRNTAKMRSVQYRPVSDPGRFDVSVTLHEVPKLITEDYSPAIDFRIDPVSKLYVPQKREGTLLLRDGREVINAYSPNAFLLYKSFFVEGIRRALEAHPGYHLDRVVWRPPGAS